VPLHPGVKHTDTHRIAVDDHLRILGVSHAFAIGDVAAELDRKGQPLPMLATAAMQAGRYVARQIVRNERGHRFRYFT